MRRDLILLIESICTSALLKISFPSSTHSFEILSAWLWHSFKSKAYQYYISSAALTIFATSSHQIPLNYTYQVYRKWVLNLSYGVPCQRSWSLPGLSPPGTWPRSSWQGRCTRYRNVVSALRNLGRLVLDLCLDNAVRNLDTGMYNLLWWLEV